MLSHEQFADDLTRYLLAELTPPESAELERHLGACGACRSELEKLQGDVALLALSAPLEQPPARARQRLLDSITREPKLVPLAARPQRSPMRAWWAWSPALAAFAFAVVAALLWHDNQDLRHQAGQLASIVTATQLDYQNTKELLSALTDRDAKHVTLVAAGASPQPHGKGTYIEGKGTLVFLASNLGQLPPRKAYQLWLVPSSGGKLIPAGTFKPDERGTAMVMRHSMPRVKLKTFAVTIEQEEGVNAPTSPMVLVGAGGV